MVVVRVRLSPLFLSLHRAKLSADELKMSDFKAYLASDSDESDLDDDEEGVEPQFVFELETPAGVEETADQKKQGRKTAKDEKIDPKRRDKYKALLGALNPEEEEQQDMEVYALFSNLIWPLLTSPRFVLPWVS
jgi:hypothetical protein